MLAWPDGHEEVFEGRAEGRVVWPPRGTFGHGYDPVFVPEGQELIVIPAIPGPWWKV